LARLHPSDKASVYKRLVKGYGNRVFAVCLSMLGNSHDAEDVAQQTLLKGFANIRQLQDEQKFGAWICRIARNLCVDFTRKRQREKLIDPACVAPHRNGCKDYQELHRALTELSDENRTALMLYYFDGKSSRSVAESMGISESAAQARLSRARKQLRSILEADRST